MPTKQKDIKYAAHGEDNQFCMEIQHSNMKRVSFVKILYLTICFFIIENGKMVTFCLDVKWKWLAMCKKSNQYAIDLTQTISVRFSLSNLCSYDYK